MYGKKVMKLASVFEGERLTAYLSQREAAYKLISQSYEKAGMPKPSRTILSGEMK